MCKFELAVTLCIFTVFLTGSIAEKDFRNKTIECVFRQYNDCYKTIGSLGANFSARYDETPAEINATCNASSKITAERCISNITTGCNTRLDLRVGLSINSFIDSLCTNKSKEQTSFLNSSACYNKNQKTRIDCMTSNSPGSNTDAKSLCCSFLMQEKCLLNNMTLVCPHNATFQSHLVLEYRKVHSILCGPYFQYCNTAPVLSGYLLPLLLGIVMSFLRLL